MKSSPKTIQISSFSTRWEKEMASLFIAKFMALFVRLITQRKKIPNESCLLTQSVIRWWNEMKLNKSGLFIKTKNKSEAPGWVRTVGAFCFRFRCATWKLFHRGHCKVFPREIKCIPSFGRTIWCKWFTAMQIGWNVCLVVHHGNV